MAGFPISGAARDNQNIAATNADDGGQTFHENSTQYVASIVMASATGSDRCKYMNRRDIDVSSSMT
jgi:hypothetical protein